MDFIADKESNIQK